MQRYFLVTVDCDLRARDVAVRQASLDALLDVFAEVGLAGRVTWFLNENDFLLTENHESFLHEAARRGDTLGVHDHLERFLKHYPNVAVEYQQDTVQAYCRQSLQRVRDWLGAHGYDAEITAHRNGCLAQDARVYAALAELGYTVLSDLWPGHRGTDRSGSDALDNEDIPLGVLPYRHDPDNFTDHESTAGQFWHVPNMEMHLAPFRLELMRRWDQAFVERDAPYGVFTWIFHPYEILTDGLDAVSPGLVGLLKWLLEHFIEEYQVEYISIAELQRRIAGV